MSARIIASFLTEQREACINVPKVFDSGFSVTLAKQLFDLPAIGQV
ncbi:hypothetical protein [Dyadobacter sp. CY326]|nr:hypothetical protein [Dyadobacter sp. CY326]MCE7067203.1 hypothetical protein [Dyadobacter sp. CY326]